MNTLERMINGEKIVARMSEKARKAQSYEEIFVCADSADQVDNIQVDDWSGSVKTVTAKELEEMLEAIYNDEYEA